MSKKAEVAIIPADSLEREAAIQRKTKLSEKGKEEVEKMNNCIAIQTKVKKALEKLGKPAE